MPRDSDFTWLCVQLSPDPPYFGAYTPPPPVDFEAYTRPSLLLGSFVLSSPSTWSSIPWEEMAHFPAFGLPSSFLRLPLLVLFNQILIILETKRFAIQLWHLFVPILDYLILKQTNAQRIATYWSMVTLLGGASFVCYLQSIQWSHICWIVPQWFVRELRVQFVFCPRWNLKRSSMRFQYFVVDWSFPAIT